MSQPLLRTALAAGLILSVFMLTFQPGLATAVAVLAYLGWSRENALRVAAIDRLRDAGRELEREGRTLERLQAVEALLRQAAVLRVERGHGTTITVSTVVDDMGEPPTKTEH